MDEHEHIEYHEKAAEAFRAHLERSRRNGVIGQDFKVSCAISPGDTVTLRRQGPAGLDSSYASLNITQHGEPSNVMLSASAARRLAAALLDIADEIEPYVKGSAADDQIGGER